VYRLGAAEIWGLLILLASLVFPAAAAQNGAPLPDAPGAAQTTPAATPAANNGTSAPAGQPPDSRESHPAQHIFGIVPGFHSVSMGVQLPPQTPSEKFSEATEDRFNCLSIVYNAAAAGEADADSSYPEFGSGAAAYGRYFWRDVVDQTDENYQVEFIFPLLLHQDTRYYRLGHGGILRRTGYSFSRVFVGRTDAGHATVNASELIGSGAAAGISDLYCPDQARNWTKTGQRWLVNGAVDGATFIVKEFWQDVSGRVFRRKN